ncbi:MAG: hypothetical protein U1E13_09060 [Methylophilaceae bacterium]|nr:hypothetical protein [Methylophilaceae bacterium]
MKTILATIMLTAFLSGCVHHHKNHPPGHDRDGPGNSENAPGHNKHQHDHDDHKKKGH